MIRVKKTDGWNRYKLQKRHFYFFWRDIAGKEYVGKGNAMAAAVQLELKFEVGVAS